MNTSPHDFREAYQASAIETTLPPGNNDEMEVELAGPWARMGAYLINSLLSVVVMLPFIIAAWPLMVAELSGQSINADNINPGGIFISLAISMESLPPEMHTAILSPS